MEPDTPYVHGLKELKAEAKTEDSRFIIAAVWIVAILITATVASLIVAVVFVLPDPLDRGHQIPPPPGAQVEEPVYISINGGPWVLLENMRVKVKSQLQEGEVMP